MLPEFFRFGLPRGRGGCTEEDDAEVDWDSRSAKRLIPSGALSLDLVGVSPDGNLGGKGVTPSKALAIYTATDGNNNLPEYVEEKSLRRLV